jgi:tryptophan-rich sensory protein
VKIHHILLIVWTVVFAMWAYKQVVAYNKKTDRD